MKFERKRLLDNLIKVTPKFIRYPFLRSRINIKYNLDPEILFKPATTENELIQAFRILHDSYAEVGLMEPSPSQMRITDYHYEPSSIVYVAVKGDDVIGTFTIIRDSVARGLPIDKMMNIDSLKQRKAHEISSIGEISALAVKSGWRGKIFWALIKYIYHVTYNELGLKGTIVVAHSEWHQFYECFLTYEPINGKIVKTYSFANNLPVKALYAEFKSHLATKLKDIYDGKPKEKNLYELFTGTEFTDRFLKATPFFSIVNPCYNHPLLTEEKEDKNIHRLNPDGKEKRRLPSCLRVWTESDESQLLGMAYNFSDQGVLISLSSPSTKLKESQLRLYQNSTNPDMTKFDFRLEVAPGTFCHLSGEVRWQMNHTVLGLKVLNADAIWAQFLSAHQIQNEKPDKGSDNPLTAPLRRPIKAASNQ